MCVLRKQYGETHWPGEADNGGCKRVGLLERRIDRLSWCRTAVRRAKAIFVKVYRRSGGVVQVEEIFGSARNSSFCAKGPCLRAQYYDAGLTRRHPSSGQT